MHVRMAAPYTMHVRMAVPYTIQGLPIIPYTVEPQHLQPPYTMYVRMQYHTHTKCTLIVSRASASHAVGATLSVSVMGIKVYAKLMRPEMCRLQAPLLLVLAASLHSALQQQQVPICAALIDLSHSHGMFWPQM